MIPELSEIDAEDYWIQRSLVRIEEDNILFDLHVTSSVEDVDCWYTLTASNVVAYELSSRQDGDLFSLGSNHPLLVGYCDPISALYCRTKEAQGDRVLHAVLNAHGKYAGRWLRPFDYINPHIVNGWSFGQLAKGPKSLVAAYHDAIVDLCTHTSVLDLGSQKDWDGSMYRERDVAIVGLSFGASYILCKQYKLAKKAVKPTA